MLFDRIARPRADFARASAGAPSYGLIPPLGSVASSSGQLISQATAMSVSTVYACVRRRAQDMARCPPSLYTVDADGTRHNVDDHPLSALFDKPNRVQTWLEFAEQMEVALLLRGNAYAAVLRDGNGIPREFIPINPDAVMVLEAENGDVFYQTNRIGLFQMDVLRGLPMAIPAEDMFHIRGLTFNSLVAVSTIGLGRDAIGLAAGQEQQASRWMANGARPAGVLESDKPLSEDAGKRLYDRWQAFKAGIQNVGSTAVLEDGVKWKAMSLTSVDLEFLNARTFQVPEICRFFSVPPHKIYVIDRAASMSIPQQDQDYVNSTIAPDLERWEQKIEDYFALDRDDINCHFDEGQLLRADVMTRFNALRVGILTGIITPNEARETEGLPALPGGDHLLVPANTAALGSDMTGSPADEAGRPTAGDPAPAKVGTGGTQKTDDDDPELVGAEELEPRATLLRPIPVERRLLLSGVPVRHQAKIRARLKGRRVVPAMVIRALPDSAVRLAPPRVEPTPAPAPAAAEPQPIALTVNVDASKPLVRRLIRKAEDGSLEVVEVPLTRYSEDQPRDEKGKFVDEGPKAEAGAANGSGAGNDTSAGSTDAGGGVLPDDARLNEIADTWVLADNRSLGNWTDIQHAARYAISGGDPKNYLCYDCGGDDQKRLAFAQELLAAVNNSPTLDQPLYRGITAKAGTTYNPGDTFSESLSSWTADQSLATKFATGNTPSTVGYSEVKAGNVLFKVTGTEMKGLSLSDHLSEQAAPQLRTEQEYLTSGHYQVTSSTVVNGVTHVTVLRIGDAVKPDLARAKRYSEDQPRDEKGRWIDEGPKAETSSSGGSGGGAGGASSPAALAAALTQSTTPSSDLHTEFRDASVTPASIRAAQPQATQDAMAKADAGLASGRDTADIYGTRNPDGTYTFTPEREALQNAWIDQKLSASALAEAAPAPGEKPTYTILGGRGGSGKGWLTSEKGPLAGSKAIVLNSDEIKEMLPEYQGWNAGLLHVESEQVFNRLAERARAAGVSVIHDATMKTEATSQAFVNDFKAAGYDVSGHYMFAPEQTAAQQSIDRFMNGTARLTDEQRAAGMTGRYVNPGYVLSSNSNEKTFDNLISQFSKWSVYSNVVKGSAPKLVAKSP